LPSFWVRSLYSTPIGRSAVDGEELTLCQSLAVSAVSIRLHVALKGQGVSADEAGKQISAELKAEHPDWPDTSAAGFVKSLYAESQ